MTSAWSLINIVLKYIAADDDVNVIGGEREKVSYKAGSLLDDVVVFLDEI